MKQLQLDPDTYVYLAARNGAIKIGHSADPARRAEELNATLLVAWTGTHGDEHALQIRFARYLIAAEWFWPAPEILQYVALQARRVARDDVLERWVDGHPEVLGALTDVLARRFALPEAS